MGLPPEIRKHVILSNPSTFEEAQQVPQRAETLTAGPSETSYSDPVSTVDKVLTARLNETDFSECNV